MGYRSRKHTGTAINEPETAYARAKSVEWLLRVMEVGVAQESNFFECLGWSIGGFKRPLQTRPL
jgi:hypothetical protein